MKQILFFKNVRILELTIFGILIFFIGGFNNVFAKSGSIIEAAKWGKIDEVNKLLKDNPDLINFTDKGLHATALHWAAIYGRKEVVKVLVRYKADVNKEEDHKGTSLHWAAHHDDPEVIKILLAHNAKIDAVNRFGRTPLLVAVRRGNIKLVEILINSGASIKVVLNDKSTALHIAARNGHVEVTKFLIDQGLDPKIKNDKGQTYLNILFKKPEIIKIDQKILPGYAGVYERKDGRKMIFRMEKNHLYYFAFGKDELLPIAPDKFIGSAESGKFTFLKNRDKVTDLIYKIGKWDIEAKKIK